ncbi:hypothetical protein DFH08DRAFT_62543 [Mycena albidolilacea]|uniref:Uncharacterized protein n=1 Tax=Mycena albidolilacea TaxID=1033008 RepID=A0AAD7AA70_9AGAR|nr:hypothetical protein DFH08DRAFT_62543 [Mycena albidolilacea]
MKFSNTVATLIFTCFVSATGIFSPDGQVALIQSEPSAGESSLVGSNADRMPDGLPLPPAPWASGTGRCGPSALCGTSGYIQISRASNGEVLGYVRKTFNNITRYTYDTLDKALVVNLPASCSSGAFDLVPTNGPDAVHNNVGAVTGAYGFDFKPGRLGYAYLSGTGHVDANSRPSNSTGTSMQSRLGYKGAAESQVWSLNYSTGGLTAQWTNADSTNPTTSLYYARTSNYVGLVGDFDRFVARFAWEDAFLVTAAFYPAPPVPAALCSASGYIQNSKCVPQTAAFDPVPCALCGASGYIQISRISDGGILGYIRKTFEGNGLYALGTREDGLVVKLPASCGSGAFDLVATNGPDAVNTNFGAVGGLGGYNFNPGNIGYAYLSGTSHLNASSPPSFTVGNSIRGQKLPSESQIWSLDCPTGRLTAQWTNADSTNAPTNLVCPEPVGSLKLVGDFNKFVATYYSQCFALVTATFVPI